MNYYESPNDHLLKRFRKAKQSRIDAEEHSNKLKNKIACLKLKEIQSSRKIEKFKTLAYKIAKVQEERITSQETNESRRREYREAVKAQTSSFKEKLMESKVRKKENVLGILLRKQDVCLDVKEKQKYEEFLMRQEFAKKIEKNREIRGCIMSMREEVANEICKEKKIKAMETQRMLAVRVLEEGQIVLNKIKEKETERDVELGVLEFLYAGMIR